MDAAEAGDEAYMLAKHLPEVPVLIGAERAKTGRYAMEHFGAEVAILDDGYQHWQLERDLDILLVDAVNVFGNGYILPRGTLREPISHISRADMHRYNPEARIVESIHQPRCFIPLTEWYVNIASQGIDIAQMRGKRIMAVSAIGNPASFEQTLSDLGAVIIESLRYPDHHDYAMSEMTDIFQQAENAGAEAIVITEKDAVKIPADVAREKWSIPIYVICVEVNFQKGSEGLANLLKKRLAERLGH